ncbi:MAG: CPBP family intramembrane metalloprotease [Oscillospiraceae bacterium]|nr:CPBP family intramembrane metalloprotease [Oscillospiraceae bacterium]
MPEASEYTDLIPEDAAHPFGNPTEEPDYSPDYREIVPELSMAGARLPLIPTLAEKHAIRRYVGLTCLTLLFAFLTAASIHTALTLLCRLLLQMRDSRAMESLPQNYNEIAAKYLNDSSVSSAITLVAFLCGNLIAFFTGCTLTRIKKADLFRTRGLSFLRVLCYIGAALWIQLTTSYLCDWLTGFLRRAGISVVQTEIHLGAPGMKLAVMALYTVLVAPVTEELLMRGFALKNLSRVSQRGGILLTAFLFGIMHRDPAQFLFAFPLGILLGYITVRHDSLLPAILVHMAVNASSLLQLCGKEYLPADTFRVVLMSASLSVLALGTVAAVYLFLTERLPDNTPYQSLRGGRVTLGSPLLWALIAANVGAAVYTGLF